MKPLPSHLQAVIWAVWQEHLGEVVNADTLWSVRKEREHKSFQQFVEHETMQIWGQVEPLLSNEFQERANRAYFTLVPAYDFNGVACRLNSGELVIGISTSLFAMYFADVYLYRTLGLLDKILPVLREGQSCDLRLGSEFGKQLDNLRAVARLVAGDRDAWDDFPHESYEAREYRLLRAGRSSSKVDSLGS